MQVRMFGFTPSQDFQDVISDEVPDDLPDPLIDNFTDEVLPSEAAADIAAEPASEPDAIDFPTVAVTAGDAEMMAFEEAAALEDSESDDDGDAGGVADLMMFLPFLGILAAFM